MIYTKLTRKALQFATKAHAGQVDKAGAAYILHPFYLAEQMGDDQTCAAVALLHDVIEDSECTLDDLIAAGFPKEVTDAVDLLTHRDGIAYTDYIKAIKLNPIARRVKLEDLRHNSDRQRLDCFDASAHERRKKHLKALSILTDGFLVDEPFHSYTQQAEFRKLYNRRFLDRIRGCMIGSAVGDSLGYAVGDAKYADILKTFGDKGITGYQLKVGKALISDNTQMAMFTAVGLLQSETDWLLADVPEVPLTYLRNAHLEWCRTQQGAFTDGEAWICRYPEMFQARAPKRTRLSALKSGGIVRVLPVALFADPRKTVESVDSFAAEVAAITQARLLGQMSAAALTHMIFRLIFGGCSYGDSPHGIVRECKETLNLFYGTHKELQTLFSLIDLACKLAGNDKPDEENIRTIGLGWVPEETFAIALYCFMKYPTDFDRAVTAAVNHSGDSASAGALTGAILGALIGYEGINGTWKEPLELRDVILTLSDDLCDHCRMGMLTDNYDAAWADRYGAGVKEEMEQLTQGKAIPPDFSPFK